MSCRRYAANQMQPASARIASAVKLSPKIAPHQYGMGGMMGATVNAEVIL